MNGEREGIVRIIMFCSFFIDVQVAQGSYSYTAPDGQLITITYIADENGNLIDHFPNFST